MSVKSVREQAREVEIFDRPEQRNATPPITPAPQAVARTNQRIFQFVGKQNAL